MGTPHDIRGAQSFRNGEQSLDGKQLDRAHEDGARMSEVSELILEIIAPLFAMEEVVPQAVDDDEQGQNGLCGQRDRANPWR